MTLFALLLLAAQSAFSPQAAAPGAGPPARMEGFVVRVGTSTPVTRSEVSLVPAQGNTSPDSALTATTDGGGRFIIDNIPPGAYRVNAAREGYVAGRYGASSAREVGAVVELASGQTVRDIVVGLIPTGVISGTLQDRYGEPYVNAVVEALEWVYEGGDRILRPVKSTTTNDRGEYRLFWLPPGSYVVRASPPGGAAGDIQTFNLDGGQRRITFVSGGNATSGSSIRGGVSTPTVINEAAAEVRANVERVAAEFALVSGRREPLAPIYYPGTIDASFATTIELGAGVDFSGVNIRMFEVATVAVSGQLVAGASGTNLLRTTMLRLAPSDPGVGRGEISARAEEDGSFEFTGVVPGAYDLTAQLDAYVDGTAQTLYARVEIDVGNADVNGVRVALEPGLNISGRVEVEGESLGLEGLFVRLDGRTSGRAIRLNTDGSFEFTDRGPGNYEISLNGVPQGTYVREIRIGSQVLVDGTVRLGRRSIQDLVIELGRDPGTVRLQILGNDGVPLADQRLQVVLVPDPARRARGDQYRSMEVTDGVAQFDAVPPGSYKAFVWDGVPEGAWRNAEFIARYEDQGVPILVSPLGAVAEALRVVAGP